MNQTTNEEFTSEDQRLMIISIIGWIAVLAALTPILAHIPWFIHLLGYGGGCLGIVYYFTHKQEHIQYRKNALGMINESEAK